MISEENHLFQSSVILVLPPKGSGEGAGGLRAHREGRMLARHESTGHSRTCFCPHAPTPLYQNKRWSKMTKKQASGTWDDFREPHGFQKGSEMVKSRVYLSQRIPAQPPWVGR